LIALLCAAKEGHIEIFEKLLNHGANIEQIDMGRGTAFYVDNLERSYKYSELIAFGEQCRLVQCAWCGLWYGRPAEDIIIDIRRMLVNVGQGSK
jgi:hypothetical protein